MLEIIDLQEPSDIVAGLKMACGSDDVTGKYIPVEGGSIQILTICKPGKEMQNIRITQIAGSTAPEIACPADLNLTGDVINEADNCSVGLEATYTDRSDITNPCEQTITRLWSLMDNCGNYLTKHQIITIVPSTGISKIIDKPTLIIYPNPSSGTINLIYSSEPGDVMISISDMTGRKVFEQGFSNSAGEIKEVVDILINGAGIYFLQLVDDSCVLFHRLVVE